MLAKLALAIFLMANGSLVGPLAIGVKDAPFPSVKACEEFVASKEGKALAAQADAFAKAQFGKTATVVPQCVALTGGATKQYPISAPGEGTAIAPARGTRS